jgi:RimJ/RimL family protein N-acetyltransferase
VHNLVSERLDLRRWEVEDADFVFDMYSRWEVQRYIGRVPKVMEDRSEAVALIERLRSLDHPVHGYWAVAEKATRQLLGTILLKPIPASGDSLPLRPSGDTEIGWHFHPDSWGNGYASEAASVVLEHAFRSGLEKVVAVTSPANHASQKVCLRIGMVDVGLTDAYYNTSCALFVTQRLAALDVE